MVFSKYHAKNHAFTYIDNISTNTTNYNGIMNRYFKLSTIPRQNIYTINQTYFGPFSYSDDDVKVPL